MDRVKFILSSRPSALRESRDPSFAVSGDMGPGSALRAVRDDSVV